MTDETKPSAGGTGTTSRTKEITSRKLLGERRELCIIHNGERYTLRITANDKLILTK